MGHVIKRTYAIKKGYCGGRKFSANRLSPLAAAVLLTFASAATAADIFTGLGDFSVPSNQWSSSALAISADGTAVVGDAGLGGAPGRHAFRWTSSDNTMHDLGTLGGSTSLASSVSANGSAVVGWSYVTGDTYYRAFFWTSSDNTMHDLGTLGGTYSSASGISANGRTVVGWANTAGGAVHAFRWADNTMSDLGTLGGTISDGRAVSADGTVVVGYSKIAGDSASHAFRWTTSDNTMHDLGTLTGGVNSFATSVSSDGTVVVGYSSTAGGTDHAFRWTSPGGMTDLGILTGGTYSYANSVSGDGKVVVGTADDAGGHATAIRWTQTGGMQSVAQWLANSHVNVPVGWSLGHASGTNNDGSVITGYGSNPSGQTEAWIARAGSGLITPSSYLATLGYSGDMPRLGINLANLTLFGAHHRPLMDSKLPSGHCAWATADTSHSNSYNTDQQLAEAGACADPDTHWRIGLGIGASYTRQGSTYYGSEGKYQGQYIYAEADYAPESRAWIGSLSAMYSDWSTSIRRGYLNAGAIDQSTGRPDASIWTVRARVDWKDVAKLGMLTVAPFVSLSHTDSHLDAYTETGGGFPARINAINWYSDEVRLGAVLQTAITPSTDLRINLEAAHRLDQSGPGISGQIVGISSFSLAGAKATSTWSRILFEVDHRLTDKSLVSASVNGATSGDDPSWGVSVGYKRAF